MAVTEACKAKAEEVVFRDGPEEKKGCMSVRNTTTDILSRVIEQAVESGVKRALNISETTNRRLLSVEQAAVYLSLSERELYNMISNHQLRGVKHGRRKMIDIRDLDEWVESKKTNSV